MLTVAYKIVFHIWLYVVCGAPSIRSQTSLSITRQAVQHLTSSQPEQTVLLPYRDSHVLRGQPPTKTEDTHGPVGKALQAFADRLPVGINHAY